MRAQGRLDSSGGFSLSWKEAARKLGEYRLSSPFHYVLRLVRAGVLAGASRIDVQTSLEHTRVTFDASLGELERLLDHLVGSGPAHELAVAAAAAMATRPFSLVVESGGVRWDGESLGVGGSGTVFDLRRKRQGNWLRELFTAFSPEAEVLARRCAFCPVPLRVNRRLLNRPQEFGSPRIGFLMPPDHFVVEARYPQPGPNLVALPVPSQASRCWGGEHALVGCALGLCHGRPSFFRPTQGNSFLFVHGGVALYREELPMEGGPLMGILSTDGLTLDLSGDRVVKDASYETRVEWLRAHAAWLRRFAASS